MTLPTTAIGPATAPHATTPARGLSDNYQSFLNLLVAQVSHQDPLDPVDGTEFVAQLATLTGVEQSLKMNEQMEALRAQMGLSAALSESSLIGRRVTVPSETVMLEEDGARFSYELAAPSDSVTAIITDAAGNPVRELPGLPGTAGERIALTWDGTDATGAALPPGRYGVALAASGAAGGYNTYASFRVMSVSFDAGRQYLDLDGGGAVTSDQILRID